MSASFEMDEPTQVTVGTVGPAGARTFYLQARQVDRLVTLKLEKGQVAALVELLAELLADLPPTAPDASGVLEEPVLAEWAVGSLQLTVDPLSERVVLLAEELTDQSEEGADEGAIGRLSFTREQAAGMVVRGGELLSAGRPPCPLCGHPMDPSGHSCPKTNGHRAPSL